MDGKGTEDFSTCAHHHTIFKRGVALAFIPSGTAKRNTMIKRDIITNFGSFTNHHTHAMIDKKTFANFCARMNLNTCGKSAKRGKQSSRAFVFFFPEFMGHTMHDQSMNPRVGGEDFQRIACSRITCKYSLNVFFKLFNHWNDPPLFFSMNHWLRPVRG